MVDIEIAMEQDVPIMIDAISSDRLVYFFVGQDTGRRYTLGGDYNVHDSRLHLEVQKSVNKWKKRGAGIEELESELQEVFSSHYNPKY